MMVQIKSTAKINNFKITKHIYYQCCGCFGPAGGTDDYCGTDCKKRRNGTIVKNFYSWFWVRSSIPKKVWKKCMDYKVTTPNGDTVRYKLLDRNPTPEKVKIRLVTA
jgi:hypothetical protein